MPGRTAYPGIGRLAYVLLWFGASVAIWVLMIGGSFVAAALTDSGAARIAGLAIGGLVGMAGSIWVMVQRLNNAGYSGWWCIGSFIPLLNIFVAFLMLVAPEGYADHKTLDTSGKVVCGLFIGFMILAVIASAVSG